MSWWTRTIESSRRSPWMVKPRTCSSIYSLDVLYSVSQMVGSTRRRQGSLLRSTCSRRELGGMGTAHVVQEGVPKHECKVGQAMGFQ